MRKMRFLTVLAAILLSCGIANAQTVKGDVNNDGNLNVLDVKAAADSIMDGKTSGLADVNEDQKVNAADVVTVVNLIEGASYFYLGTQEPTSENFTTLGGFTTMYESLDKVLKDAPSLSIEHNERGYLLCPTSWDAKDLVLQNYDDGEFFELTKTETDISGYTLFKTKEVEGGAVTTALKTKAAAEEYYAQKHPADDGKNWFWMGNYFPKSNTFPTINGEEVPGIVKNYISLDEAMANSARAYTANEYAVVLYPSKWGAKDDLVFIDNTNKKYYAVKKKEVSDFPDYIYYETAKKIGVNTTLFLSTESTVKGIGYTLYEESTPQTPQTPENPPTPPTPGGGNGVTFVLQNNCGKEVRLTGRVTLNISTNPTNWASSIQVPANPHGPQVGASWAYNDIIIPAGGSYSWTTNEIPAAYTAGNYYLMSTDKDQYNYSIYLYSRIWRTSKGKTEGSTGMYRVYPLQNARLQNGTTYYLNLYWANPEASLDPDRSGKYIILGYGKQSL